MLESVFYSCPIYIYIYIFFFVLLLLLPILLMYSSSGNDVLQRRCNL